MNELISVIVNVYNGEKYIKKCLDSIIKQTYKNIEIIIVNDGSTDKTLEICNSYDDKRIKIINQENKGLSESRNIGIENSSGKYLYFVDADDFIEDDVIEYLHNLCKKYNVKLATCRPLDIYNYDFKVSSTKESVKIINSKEMLKKIFLTIDRAGTIWNKLISRELFDSIRFENRIINDVCVTYKIVLEAEKIAYSNQIKYYYLRRRDSITGIKSEDRSIDLYKACIERYDVIKKQYPNFLENETGMILIIMMLDCSPGEKLKEFFKENKANELAKKLFTFKIMFLNIGIKNKIKILLYKVSPKIYKRFIINYQKINYSQLS